jgi:hypothetical protein
MSNDIPFEMKTQLGPLLHYSAMSIACVYRASRVL